MNISTSILVTVAGTVVFFLFALPLLKGAEGASRKDLVTGALFRSVLYGIIVGFVIVPFMPPIPRSGGIGTIIFLLGPFALELVRSNILASIMPKPLARAMDRYTDAILAQKERGLAKRRKAIADRALL